jgi:hypothetical protein
VTAPRQQPNGGGRATSSRVFLSVLPVPRMVVSTPYAVKLLRHFTRARQSSGLPIHHGRMKQYRDALRALERFQWREEGLLQ